MNTLLWPWTQCSEKHLRSTVSSSFHDEIGWGGAVIDVIMISRKASSHSLPSPPISRLPSNWCRVPFDLRKLLTFVVGQHKNSLSFVVNVLDNLKSASLDFSNKQISYVKFIPFLFPYKHLLRLYLLRASE